MITVRCKKCNTTLTSNHKHDYKVCICDNQTYVSGDIFGGNNLDNVVHVKIAPKKETPPPKLGTDKPRKRTTRMIDVDIR